MQFALIFFNLPSTEKDMIIDYKTLFKILPYETSSKCTSKE